MKITVMVLAGILPWTILALDEATPTPPPEAPTNAPPALPTPASPSYRAVLTGLTDQNAAAVKAALLAIPNVENVLVMPKAGFVRIDMKDVAIRLYRKQVEEALAQVPNVTVTRFFNLRPQMDVPSI